MQIRSSDTNGMAGDFRTPKRKEGRPFGAALSHVAVIAAALFLVGFFWRKLAAVLPARFAQTAMTVAYDFRAWLLILFLVVTYFAVPPVISGIGTTRPRSTTAPIESGFGEVSPWKMFSLVGNMSPDAVNNQPKHWAIAVTAPPHNQSVKDFLEVLADQVGRGLQSTGPRDQNQNWLLSIRVLPLPSRINRDTPFPPPSDTSTIIIHGEDQLSLRWARALNDCLDVQHTEAGADKISDYYLKRQRISQSESVIWIEIGNGSPWTHDSRCLATPPNDTLRPRQFD